MSYGIFFKLNNERNAWTGGGDRETCSWAEKFIGGGEGETHRRVRRNTQGNTHISKNKKYVYRYLEMITLI